MIHVPVLGEEVGELLVKRKEGVYVDCTIGEGGHSLILLQKFPHIRILGLDMDEEILGEARKNLAPYQERVTLRKGNFRDIDIYLKKEGLQRVDGFLFDLGISSYHLESSGRGFSFKKEEPLDMRMDQDAELTAYQIVNFWPSQKLIDILKSYGEERRAQAVVRKMVKERRKKPLQTTRELAELIRKVVRRSGKIDPATRTFQAIRIAVNDELTSLEIALRKVPLLLKKGGRVVVISYHSLEDRIVKHIFKEEAKEGYLRVLTPKPVRPTDEEVSINPRSRSAKLRAGERIES